MLHWQTTREEFLLRRENLTTGEMMVRGQRGEQQGKPHATSSQVHVFIDVTSFFFSDKFWPQAVRWPGLLYWSFFMHLVFYNHILAAPRCARDITKSRTVSSKRAVNPPTKRERLERFREYLTNGERVARDVVAAKTWGCIRDEGAPVDQGGRLAQHGSGGRERTSKRPGPVWWKAVRTLKKTFFCRLGGLSHGISTCVSHFPRKEFCMVTHSVQLILQWYLGSSLANPCSTNKAQDFRVGIFPERCGIGIKLLALRFLN